MILKRMVAFKALVGSANYNLATPESDQDYKVFVLPTFDDLYHNYIFTKSNVGSSIDEEYHDIRKLIGLLWKSNVNFMEVLFSIDVIQSDNKLIREAMDQLFKMRDQIAAMNLPYLYKACKGMYVSKAKYIEEGNNATKEFVHLFGYDTKSAMHTYRILDFIERFANNRFTNFKNAITYSHSDREFLLSIKHGAFTKSQILRIIDAKLQIFGELEQTYLKQKPKEDVKEQLEKIIYQLTANVIRNQLVKISNNKDN